MKAPGEILLVACYELGHQPLAVAWPAAFLERLGYRPALMDVSVEPFDERRARAGEARRHLGADAHRAPPRRRGRDRVRAVNPDCHLCFYGLYASLNADYLLSRGADSVIGGEVEGPLAELAQALEAGAADAGVRQPGRTPPGPISAARLPRPEPRAAAAARTLRAARARRAARAGRVRRGEPRLPPSLPPLPDPARVRRPLLRRAARRRPGRHPPAGRGRRHAHHVRRPRLPERPRRTRSGSRARSTPSFRALTFDFTAKIEHLLRHRELLPELAACGGIFVVSAAESLSETVLEHLDKGHTRADIDRRSEATREAGIALRPTWVAFTPWTTLDDYREMLDFVEAEGLIDHVDPVQYSLRLLVPPGSLLVDSAAMRPVPGRAREGRSRYRWTHPDPRMDELQETVAARSRQGGGRREDAAVDLRHRARPRR